MSNRDTSRARLFHEETKHSYWSVRKNAHYLDWANQPAPFKIYLNVEAVRLPQDLIQTGVPALAAIASLGVDADHESVPTLEQLASILFYSAGVTKSKNYPGGTIYFRAAACAGALYPIETYVVAGEIAGLEAGIYHFNPGDFSLKQLRKGDYRSYLNEAAAGDPQLSSSPVALIYTAVSWRSSWKYQSRAYRYHFWDNGTIIANALALADSHRLPARLVMGFVEEEINALIGIDGERELALSILSLGHSEANRPAPASIEGLRELGHEVVPLSHSQVDYSLISNTHKASELGSGSEVREWRNGVTYKSLPEPQGDLIPLDPVGVTELPAIGVEEVVQRRASTRRFAKKPIDFSALSTILDRVTRGTNADFLVPESAQLNDLYLIVNRVNGLSPGAYYFRREARALELIKEGEFADRASYLALDQSLAGDASVSIFFMADLDSLLARYGNRGYRVAQMEAGIIGGKAYLAAYALGKGATGLTFYDDDVTEFFSPHAAGKSCIFLMAIGVPGKRPLL